VLGTRSSASPLRRERPRRENIAVASGRAARANMSTVSLDEDNEPGTRRQTNDGAW
jgi:hypothetical protein